MTFLPEKLAIIWEASASGPSPCQHCGPIKMKRLHFLMWFKYEMKCEIIGTSTQRRLAGQSTCPLSKSQHCVVLVFLHAAQRSMFMPLACSHCDLDSDKWWNSDRCLEPLNILTEHCLFQAQSEPESAMSDILHVWFHVHCNAVLCIYIYD